jgi:hypothetical protein
VCLLGSSRLLSGWYPWALGRNGCVRCRNATPYQTNLGNRAEMPSGDVRTWSGQAQLKYRARVAKSWEYWIMPERAGATATMTNDRDCAEIQDHRPVRDGQVHAGPRRDVRLGLAHETPSFLELGHQLWCIWEQVCDDPKKKRRQRARCARRPGRDLRRPVGFAITFADLTWKPFVPVPFVSPVCTSFLHEISCPAQRILRGDGGKSLNLRGATGAPP